MNKLLALFLINSFFTFAQIETNNLDENGQKNGLWKGFFPESQRIRYQGTFEHGRETGTFNYYDDTKEGSLIGVRVFNIAEHC